MKIETETKYRCDGCGVEATNPTAWYTISPMMFGNQVFMTGHNMASDYCSSCTQTMRAALLAKSGTSGD